MQPEQLWYRIMTWGGSHQHCWRQTLVPPQHMTHGHMLPGIWSQITFQVNIIYHLGLTLDITSYIITMFLILQIPPILVCKLNGQLVAMIRKMNVCEMLHFIDGKDERSRQLLLVVCWCVVYSACISGAISLYLEVRGEMSSIIYISCGRDMRAAAPFMP